MQLIELMEHIEPECLEEVLDNLQWLSLKAVFLVIATRPAKKMLADGRNAHLIAFMDDYSRFIVGSVLVRAASGSAVHGTRAEARSSAACAPSST